MKKSMLLLSALALAGSALAQPKATRVSGQLEGLGDSLLINLIDMNLDQPRTKATYAVKDGKFDFTIDVHHPATLALMDLKAVQDGDAGSMKVTSFTIMPGEDAIVSGSLDNSTVTGTKFYDHVNEVMVPMMNAYKSMTRENSDSIMKAATEYAKNYITQHPDDEVSAMLITALEGDDFDKALASLTPSVRDGRMKAVWEPVVKMRKAQEERAAAAKKVVEGAVAPDFTLPTIDGKQLALKDLRGKYVVLDFWGSWCSWCIKGVPDMKKYYEKYAGKFEILGVDCNDTEEKWKAAVEKHQIPWKHVRQSNQTVNVSDMYGVQGYPTKILIDPEGKIAKVIVGENPEFYTFLDEKFGK